MPIYHVVRFTTDNHGNKELWQRLVAKTLPQQTGPDSHYSIRELVFQPLPNVRILEYLLGRWGWAAVYSPKAQQLKSAFRKLGVAVADECIKRMECAGKLDYWAVKDIPLAILDEGVLRLNPAAPPPKPRQEDKLGEQLQVAQAILNVLLLGMVGGRPAVQVNLSTGRLWQALQKKKPDITTRETCEYAQDAFGVLRDNWNLSLAENTARGRFATLVANLKSDLTIMTFQQAVERIVMWDKSPDPIDLSAFTGKPVRAQRSP